MEKDSSKLYSDGSLLSLPGKENHRKTLHSEQTSVPTGNSVLRD